MNRLSLGVQTLNRESLAFTGRSQEVHALRALEILEKSGFENVNVDFMIGLPKVQKGDILENIKTVLGNFVCIKHVSVYMLESGKYPSDWKNNSLSSDDFEAEFLEIREFLIQKQNFSHYELSNFALPGYESAHNKGYWNHEEYRGF